MTETAPTEPSGPTGPAAHATHAEPTGSASHPGYSAPRVFHTQGEHGHPGRAMGGPSHRRRPQ